VTGPPVLHIDGDPRAYNTGPSTETAEEPEEGHNPHLYIALSIALGEADHQVDAGVPLAEMRGPKPECRTEPIKSGSASLQINVSATRSGTDVVRRHGSAPTTCPNRDPRPAGRVIAPSSRTIDCQGSPTAKDRLA